MQKYQPEFADYVPLQLACAVGAIEAAQILILRGSPTSVKDKHGNNLLHLLAASCNSVHDIKGFAENKHMLLERNNQGDTPYTFGKQQNGEKHVLEALMLLSENAQNVDIDSLIASDDQKKSKKAEKRRRQKIAKLAKKEGISVEEATKRLEREGSANESSDSEEPEPVQQPTVVHVT